MIKLAIYNLKGEKLTDRNISEKVFGRKTDDLTVSQAINRYLANQRKITAHTKTRREVSGGGKKPFKQKGTGNARAGSTRSPLWIGGGITFGPRNVQNYKKKIPAKLNWVAIKMILSQKIYSKKLIVLDNFKLNKISTKQIYEIFAKLPIEEGKILIVLDKTEVYSELSLANIPYVKVIKINNINVYDLINYDFLVTTESVIELLEKKSK